MNKDQNKNKVKKKVLFVCSGNTCRSPMAEFIFKDYLRKNKKYSKFYVSSAGLFAQDGCDMTEEAKISLLKNNIKYDNFNSKQLSLDMIKKCDLIVCMTDSHYNAVINTVGKSDKIKAASFFTNGKSIDDPFGRGQEAYDKTAQSLKEMAQNVLTFFTLNKF